MISFKYSTRLVIILYNIVIKIPISKRGYLQGLNEKKIWDKYKRYGLLAELKWMFMGVVCQKRYDTIKSIPTLVVKRIKLKVPEFNFDNCDLHNPQNWGIDGENYILLDYGIDQNISKLY
jgi:hypothetical protein